MPINAKKGGWSENKLAVAQAIAEGDGTQRDIATRFNIQESTISRWKHEPEFLQRIDDMTLSLERHSLAGMLRRLDEQQSFTSIGKNEWLKIEEFKAKLQGLDKHPVELEVTKPIVLAISSDPGVLKKANDLAKKLSEIKEE